MALISIVVPVYQAEKLIEKCVDSVLGQTFSDWELVLVDDGSSDNSGKICDSYAEADSRIKAIHQQNAGVSEARNAGIAVSTGEYIAFLDSDDYFDPQMLEKLVDAIKAGGADSAGCGHINEFVNGNRIPEASALPSGEYDEEAIKNAIVRPLLHDRLEGKLFNGFIWRFLYKSSIIKDNNIQYSGAYLEDEVFLIEYFSIAKKLVVVDEPLYIYLMNPASVTRKYLKDYPAVFRNSLDMKKQLVEKYKIEKIDGWEQHTCWAGLLIAVGNEFAPGNPVGFIQRRRNLIRLCRNSLFAHAVKDLEPKGVTGNKRIVVKLIKAKCYTLLSLLYALKNRNR